MGKGDLTVLTVAWILRSNYHSAGAEWPMDLWCIAAQTRNTLRIGAEGEPSLGTEPTRVGIPFSFGGIDRVPPDSRY